MRQKSNAFQRNQTSYLVDPIWDKKNTMYDHTLSKLTEKFWGHLSSDMTAMLGMFEIVALRQMTAKLQGNKDRGPIWFFTAKDTDIASALTGITKAEMVFVSNGFDLFATVHGTLKVQNDRAVIDKLGNRFVAAWFEDSKDDPTLNLLCFEPNDAEIWMDGSSLIAVAKMMLTHRTQQIQ